MKGLKAHYIKTACTEKGDESDGRVAWGECTNFFLRRKMMKKLLGVLAAGLLVFGVAGQAKAAFTSGDLIRVMYDTSTNIEVATDMGSISNLQPTTNNTAFDPISLSSFGSAQSWSNVITAYFAVDTSATNIYIAGSSSPAMVMNGKSYSGFQSNWSSITGTYQGQPLISGSSSSVLLTGDNAGNSYYNLMDAGQGAGTYNGTLKTGTSEVNNGTGGTEYLYLFANTSGKSAVTGQLVPAPNGPSPGFTIVTLDGSTEINPVGSAVPIPPSVLLMGSGLLGLIGVGRRKLFG
jgi:hypothetical protein